MGQSQEASWLGQKPEISENFPNRAVAGSKLVGAKQQKNKQMLQTGRIEQRVDWGKNLKYREILKW